jgi:hypothetical protein
MITVPQREKPRVTRPLLASALLVWLFLGSAPAGQVVTPGGEAMASVDLWRWGIEKGGLTVAVIVLLWTHRNALMKWAEERVKHEREVAELKSAHEKALQEQRDRSTKEQIAFNQASIDAAMRYNRHLDQLLERTNETLKASAEAISGHTTALARNTDSTHRLANAVERLDQRMERVEHGK